MSKPYIFIPDLSAELPELPPDSIISRTFHQDDLLKAILFSFAQGQELSEHTASVPAIIHILEGEADIKLGIDRFIAHQGAWMYLEPNLPHNVYAKTPLRMLLIMIKKSG